MPPTPPPFIGIDLGGTNIQIGVVDAKGKLLARDRSRTKAELGADAVLKRLAKLVDKVLSKAGLDRGALGGVGIGAPGAIDVARGVVLEAVNLRWNDFPLAQRLKDELKLPVVVDNDVNVGTWGEYRLGAGMGHRDLLGVFVGTGIGGGLILNGELFHGAMFTAGEIGHTIVDADAPLGRRTLENLASRTHIVNLLTELIQSNHASLVPKLVDGDLSKIRSKVIAEAVEQKDALTLEVVNQAARYVGSAIASTVTLLSLPCVVLGGGLTEALGDYWVKQVRAAFDRSVFPPELKRCKLVASKLEDNAGVFGAALLAREKLAGR